MNIIMCFDGTNNQFGRENTNVVRLLQVLRLETSNQTVYYDPGVGTMAEPNAFSRLQKGISKLYGLAFGGGLLRKVGDAYNFLMNSWRPGDRVYLFGFSRGAYTARVLAGLLHNLGLLPISNPGFVPYVLQLNAAARSSGPRGQNSDYQNLCEDFRWSFARQVRVGDTDRRFPVHFLGLWDTVSSVGWVWDPKRFPYTYDNPSVVSARHAVSVDERRWFFRQNLLKRSPTPARQDQELWFPGVHSDVGGGYHEKGDGLWREPFEWVLRGARQQGLLVDRDRLERVLQRPRISANPEDNHQNESLKGAWLLAEIFPKMVRNPITKTTSPGIGFGRYRTILNGDRLHRSTLVRIRENTPAYEPKNLSQAFLNHVRGLVTVPDSLAYQA